MTKKKPGQILAMALNPIGFLLQGSRTGSTILNVIAPHHYLLLKSQGLTHRQQVAAVQAPAVAAYQAQQAAAQGQASAPQQNPGATSVTVPSSSPWYVVGAVSLAGALLVAAAYFTRRRR